MAQYSYGYQTREEANAALIAAAITEMGRAFGRSFQTLLEIKQEERKLPQQAMTRLETFMKLPAEKREALLKDPSFRQNMMTVLEPDLESVFRKKRKAAEQRIAVDKYATEKIFSLGAETQMEKATREEQQQKMRKETAQAAGAESETQMKQLRYNIATGVETATPLNLAFAGEIKDPIAAALFSLIPPDQLKDIALADKKQGPLHQQAQQQEWFKWGMQEGFDPALAMHMASAISKGEWDKVPLKDPRTGKPVRGKAEIELATQQMNAQTSRMSVQNTLESSIVDATMNLSQKAALPVEMAREVVMALRQGKPNPYPQASDYLIETATLDKISKQQAVEKNRIELMKNKSGITEITNTLRELINANKQGWVGPGARSQIDTDVKAMIEGLTQKTMEMYGIPREHVDTWRESIAKVVSDVSGAAMAGTAMADDLKNDLTKYFSKNQMTPLGAGFSGVMIPKQEKKFTPEQEGVMKNLYKSLTSVLQDPNTPAENKKFIADFIKNKLEPIRNDPSRFPELIGAGQQAPTSVPGTPPTPNYAEQLSWIWDQPTLGPNTFVGPVEQ